MFPPTLRIAPVTLLMIPIRSRDMTAMAYFLIRESYVGVSTKVRGHNDDLRDEEEERDQNRI